jgi:hypothetical protein
VAQYSATEITPPQAVEFQDSIDAVLAGKATLAQAMEVHAVIEGLWAWARLPWQMATDQIEGRRRVLEMVPPDRQEAVRAALGDEGAPRIRYIEDDLSRPDIEVLQPGKTSVVRAPLPPEPIKVEIAAEPAPARTVD